jgi:O-antigen biosynthesis protein
MDKTKAGAQLATKTAKRGVKAALNPKRTARTLKKIQERRRINNDREETYLIWFDNYYKSISDIADQKKESAKFKEKPLISIILPIYNTNEAHLKLCIDSVISQSYENWELCIADDASTTDISERIKPHINEHKNIKLKRLDKNQHISGASNEALRIAKGDFVALLDHDDILMPNALFEMVKALNENPGKDFFYSDEDKIDENGKHIEPFFKPDWSPDYLLSCNYITHFAVLRKSIVDKIGGFRLGTEGAQDWDLFLRFTQETKKVHHVPKMLYSWRKSETSTAKNAKSKPYAYINQQRVLRDMLATEKAPASVMVTPFMGFWQVKYSVQGLPLVSIVIPTKDNHKLTKQCIESIVEQTTYPNFEIILVDTGSTEPETHRLYESKLIAKGPVKVLEWNKTFNFSAVCNFGAQKSEGEYLLFLNNDTEVITQSWIEEMLGLAQQTEAGMVGCKLLFPTKHIQHAGVILCERDIAFHPFYNRDPEIDIFTNVYLNNIRNYAAVTAACSIVSRKKFEEVGGFDEKLRVTYNDVDLCLKLLRAGYKNIYTPYAKLYHYESMSVGKMHTEDRDKKELDEAQTIMRERWSDLLKRDPYYNDNFVQHGPGYEL